MNLPVFFILVFISGFLYAQEQTEAPMEVSLEQAVEYALKHNYEVINAKADARIADKQVWEITASGLPQVNATAEYQYFLDIPTNLVPAEFFGGEPGEFAEIQFGTEQNLALTGTVSQLVFDGSYIVGLQAARVFRELSERNYQRSETEVKSMVTQTYYLALVSSENLAIIRENLTNMEKTLSETEKQFEEGFTDAINVDQLKLNVANMRNSINNLERQEKITLDMLKFQMGMDVEGDLKLSDNLQSLFEDVSLEILSVENFDPTNHIDFRIMESQERMQLMAYRREISFYLPTLNASYTRQESAQRNEFNFFQSGESWFPTSIIGLNLNIPIFSSGMRRSKVQQAKLELEKAKNDKQRVFQSLILQKQEATAEINTAMESFNNEKENLELAETIMKRTRVMFREGMASSLELTQASDQMLTTQANFVNAMFELLEAKTKLEKALDKL
ncbi:MAG: TolC family protein [Bacteroidota bacterium]